MNEISIRIFWGPWDGEINPSPIVSMGNVVGSIVPSVPVLVKEDKSWMIRTDERKAVYSCHSKERCFNSDSYMQLLVCVIIPKGKRLEGEKSPLDLLEDIRNQFDLLFTIDIDAVLPPKEEVEAAFTQVLSNYVVVDCPWYVFNMEGKEPASFQVDSRSQLNALMRFNAYPALAHVEHLELGFKCMTTVNVSTRGGDDGMKEVQKQPWWMRVFKGRKTKEIRKVEERPKEYYEEQYKQWEELLESKDYDNALVCLKNAAEGDYLPALADLAYQFFIGSVYRHNIRYAEKCARRGADCDDESCQLWLGQILRKKGKRKEALLWLEKSGEKGQGWAAYLAGEMYEKGKGTTKNMEQAIRWYRISAKTNNFYSRDAKEALRRLDVQLYETNEYMKIVEGFRASLKWKSAEELYREGRFWEHDLSPEPFASLIVAAERGYPEAEKELGYAFVCSDAKFLGIYDEELSMKWFDKAVDGFMEQVKKEDVFAMYELGNLYYFGRGGGLGKDLSLAEQYYRMGAERGHDDCQLRIGLILRDRGEKEEALRWFVKSGEQGQGWAAYIAGEMYEKGEGTDTDLNKAVEWYTKSSHTNNYYAAEAKSALRRLGVTE